jgi:hypothetical protein
MVAMKIEVRTGWAALSGWPELWRDPTEGAIWLAGTANSRTTLHDPPGEYADLSTHNGGPGHAMGTAGFPGKDWRLLAKGSCSSRCQIHFGDPCP